MLLREKKEPLSPLQKHDIPVGNAITAQKTRTALRTPPFRWREVGGGARANLNRRVPRAKRPQTGARAHSDRARDVWRVRALCRRQLLLFCYYIRRLAEPPVKMILQRKTNEFLVICNQTIARKTNCQTCRTRKRPRNISHNTLRTYQSFPFSASEPLSTSTNHTSPKAPLNKFPLINNSSSVLAGKTNRPINGHFIFAKRFVRSVHRTF